MAVASTAAAVAAANSAQAAAAARRAECAVKVQGYQHDKATVAEMRQYADCIESLHPDPVVISPGFVLAVTATLLVAIVIGIVHEFMDGYSGVLGSLLAGTIKGVFGGVVVLVVAGVVVLAVIAGKAVVA